METYGLSLEKTLFCGQCFRWKREADGSFSGIAGGRRGRFSQTSLGAIEQDPFWRGYFDLSTDYGAFCGKIERAAPSLAESVRACRGLRILRQDPWEALCTFILSQNNHIPRIRGIVERLCERFGAPIPGGGFSFPAPQALAGCSVEELAPLRAGFRAKYVLDAARRVAAGEIDFDTLRVLPLENARAKLEEICGVGPKVADCTLLYGLHRLDAFPVDVWVRRALAAYLPGADPKEFGEAAGLLQQVLFVRIRAENGRSG